MKGPHKIESLVDQQERYIREQFQLRRVANPLHRPNSRLHPPTYLEIYWEGKWEKLTVWRSEIIFRQTAKEFGPLFSSKLFRSYLHSSAIPIHNPY